MSSDKPAPSGDALRRLQAWHRLSANPDFTEFFLKGFIPDEIAKQDTAIARKLPVGDIPAARASVEFLERLVTEINAHFREAKKVLTK